MIVGIDLGTTNSAVAYLDDDGRPQIIPNREGERVTPSVILFEGDSPVIGSMAQMNAISDPLNVIQFVKRQMGNPAFKFSTDAGSVFTAEELSAMILRRLKEDAEEFLGCEVNRAVITVPAYFDDVQRKATQDAGTIAGLEVLKVINEPTAAALAYGLNHIDKTQNIMVYDLGGGTFDVTLMTMSDRDVRIRATTGDRNLGGFNFDNEIMSHIRGLFMEQHSLDLFDDLEALQDLRQKAEYCKKVLSNKDKVSISIMAQGKSLKTEITREKFNNMINNLVNRTVLFMENVLDDASMNWRDIDKILLVGGSTRAKVIQELIENASGIKPSHEVNPDEAVAMGAAIQAGIIIASESKEVVSKIKDVNIVDVNSHSLGTICVDENGREVNVIILPRNTAIPADASDVFSTIIDEQESILVSITEGEDKDPQYVRIIGEAEVKVPKGPKNYPIRITISYDINGMVHVFASDELTGAQLGEITIDRRSNLGEEALATKAIKMAELDIG